MSFLNTRYQSNRVRGNTVDPPPLGSYMDQHIPRTFDPAEATGVPCDAQGRSFHCLWRRCHQTEVTIAAIRTHIRTAHLGMPASYRDEGRSMSAHRSRSVAIGQWLHIHRHQNGEEGGEKVKEDEGEVEEGQEVEEKELAEVEKELAEVEKELAEEGEATLKKREKKRHKKSGRKGRKAK